MINFKKIFFFLYVLIGLIISANAQTKLSSKILLIPLDDRPPCLQFPVKMGLIGDAEIVTPPRELLGRFTEFGKSDAIIKWIKTQNLKSFDAAIISLDMLAYGGLVAMREYETDTATAMKRAEFIREIRKIAPKMPIYGSSVIMRLAPTGNVVNESYRVNLARWAEISVDETKRAETAELEKKIPLEALEKYKKARARDLKLNLYAVELVRDKVFDYLILSQDDAKPNGVHIADREKLIEYVRSNNLGEKIAVQPGADEVSMLLLARAMSDKYKFTPKIKAMYSDEKIADQFMPYEDRPLRKTVSFHIKAVGGIEVENEKDADILFYVFVSRFQEGGAERFIKEIEKNIHLGISVVADVDIKGDVQGGDVKFTSLLNAKGIISNLCGYAAWNTAGNTIGTALPQGVVYKTSDTQIVKYPIFISRVGVSPKIYRKAMRIAHSQVWFLANRFFDDYIYHSVIRPEALSYIREKNWNSLRLTEEQTRIIEDLSKTKLQKYFEGMQGKFVHRAEQVYSAGNFVKCRLENHSFKLPWNRTFEAEIDFKINCK